jgi:hypothetical protein
MQNRAKKTIFKALKNYMKINITKKQYKELISMLAIANGIVGVLGDTLPETNYKKRSKKMKDLENYFLQYAADYGYDGLAQEYDSEDILDDEFYENEILPIIMDYENYSAQDKLANELAWRDFRREHSKEELDAMAEKNGGYFGVEMHDYEEKYWDEFNKNGFNRLEIKK